MSWLRLSMQLVDICLQATVKEKNGILLDKC